MIFREVAALKDLPEGGMMHVDIEDQPILLVNIDGAIFGLKDRCSHMNAPLSMGKLEGTTIECPLHRARFDVPSGKCLQPPRMGGLEGMFVATTGAGRITQSITTPDLVTYKVRVEQGVIEVGIPECL